MMNADPAHLVASSRMEEIDGFGPYLPLLHVMRLFKRSSEPWDCIHEFALVYHTSNYFALIMRSW